MAHDFNNLLMVIGGSAQQLKKSPDGPKAIRSLDMIETAVQRATSLTQKLLAFARRRTLEPRVIALPAYLREFNEVLGRTLRPDIIIRFAGLERELNAELDPDELEVALLNLAVNARDAMPEGGQLTVSLANDAFEREPGPDDLRGEFVTISVADTGTGIDADVRSRIFEPFFTTKVAGQRHGAGPQPGVRLCKAVGWRGDGEQRAGQGLDVHAVPAAQPQGRRGRLLRPGTSQLACRVRPDGAACRRQR